MKKILSSVVATCMLLMSLCNISYAASFQPIIEAEDGAVGDTLTVRVSLPANTKAVGGSFNFVYDNTKMELVEANVGSVLSGFTPSLNSNYADNKIRLSFAGTDAVSDDGGEILNATFNLTAEGTVSFSTERFKLSDIQLTSLECEDITKSITITKKAFTGLSMNDKTVTYDGKAQTIAVEGAPTDATVEYTYAKAVEGDDSLTAVDEAIDAGTYTVTATVSKEGYNNWTKTATLTINKKALTLKGVEVADKVYDGTVEAKVVNQGTVVGLAEADKNDEGKFTYGVHTATFADKNVGTDKAVSLEVDYKGTSAGNYTMTAPTDVKANIT